MAARFGLLCFQIVEAILADRGLTLIDGQPAPLTTHTCTRHLDGPCALSLRHARSSAVWKRRVSAHLKWPAASGSAGSSRKSRLLWLPSGVAVDFSLSKAKRSGKSVDGRSSGLADAISTPGSRMQLRTVFQGLYSTRGFCYRKRRRGLILQNLIGFPSGSRGFKRGIFTFQQRLGRGVTTVENSDQTYIRTSIGVAPAET